MDSMCPIIIVSVIGGVCLSGFCCICYKDSRTNNRIRPQLLGEPYILPTYEEIELEPVIEFPPPVYEPPPPLYVK